MNSTRLAPPRGDLSPTDAAPRAASTPSSTPSSTASSSLEGASQRGSGFSSHNYDSWPQNADSSADSLAARARNINPFVFDETDNPSRSDHGPTSSLRRGAGPSGSALDGEGLNQILLANLERTPHLRRGEERASHLDHMVAIVLDKQAQVSATAEARRRIVSFVNRDDVAREHLGVLAAKMNAAATFTDLGELAGRIKALRQVLQPGQSALAALQLQQRLDARRDEFALAGAPLDRQRNHSDPLAPFAGLMDSPAKKVKVGDLDVAGELVDQLGEEIAEASYLVPQDPSAPTFRLGKTIDNGGFSKIRDFIDQDGNYGKMRVLHLHDQREDRPNIRVQVTPPDSFLHERRASSKAGSPVAFEQAFSVVSGRSKPVLKLYVPLPALGIESGFFGDGSASFADRHPPRNVAAAMRTYLASINENLIALHRDDAWGDGMVHSDIKPSNVLISAQGKVNLIDFGLALPARTLQHSGVGGTRGFLAPEVLAQKTLDPCSTLYPLSAKLDVWSLATTTLLTFFGRETEVLPQLELVQSKGSDANEQLYYGVLQEYYTRDLHQLSRPAHLDEEWARVRPPEFNQNDEASVADAFAQLLDDLRTKFEATDPDLSKWFFQRVYRFDPNERLSSAELSQALSELPPLFGSAAADREVAEQLFVDAFPRAQARFEARRDRKFGPSGGPSREQLAALPTQLPGTNATA